MKTLNNKIALITGAARGISKATAKLFAIKGNFSLKIMGKALDVAYAILYLSSDESKYVREIELNIGGGIIAGGSAVPSDRKE